MRSGSVRNEPPPASTLSAPDTAPTARRASASIQEISTGQDPMARRAASSRSGVPISSQSFPVTSTGRTRSPAALSRRYGSMIENAPRSSTRSRKRGSTTWMPANARRRISPRAPAPARRSGARRPRDPGARRRRRGGSGRSRARARRAWPALPLSLLRRKQRPEIDLGDDVPVVEEEGVRAAEEGRGVEHAPARLQGPLHLARDHELDAQVQRLEVGGDPLRMIVNVDDQPIRAGFHEPPGDPFQERSPADFDQRLRGIVGEGGQAGAPPGRQDHGIHVAAAVGSSARGEGQYGSSRWTSRTRTSGNRDSMCRASFSAR